MSRQTTRDWVRSLERAAPEEQWAMLCFLAGQSVDVAEEELKGAVRRAELLLASGGDPHRRLELYGRATSSVAGDLDSPDRRTELQAGLERLAPDVAGLRSAGEALRLLRADGDLAWQCYALALLAGELAEES